MMKIKLTLESLEKLIDEASRLILKEISGRDIVRDNASARDEIIDPGEEEEITDPEDECETPEYEEERDVEDMTTASNKSMNKARDVKNDEFYTLYSDIEKELGSYRDQLRGMKVYCNCDDANMSQFYRYFINNYNSLGLAGFTCTGLNQEGRGTLVVYNGKGEPEIGELEGNGDFRSAECVELMRNCDVVVTNPPFSLFRALVVQIMEMDKKFILIGNKNAVTYNDVFPYIKAGEFWVGNSIPNEFTTPDGSQSKKVQGLCRWFTNMEIKRNKALPVLTHSVKEGYEKFDTIDAINVGKVKNVPYDYDGIIAGPIGLTDYVCPDGFVHLLGPDKEDLKFRIVGKIDTGSVNSVNIANPLINGKMIFKRIAIQKTF